MSALGQKRTFRDVQTMSALPPKADIAFALNSAPNSPTGWPILAWRLTDEFLAIRKAA
jgi:hypothetical protein